MSSMDAACSVTSPECELPAWANAQNPESESTQPFDGIRPNSAFPMPITEEQSKSEP